MLTLVEGTGEMCECACVVVVVVVLQFTVSGLTVRRRYTSPQKDLRREATLKRPKGAQTERLFLLQLTQHACVPRRVSVCLSVCVGLSEHVAVQTLFHSWNGVRGGLADCDKMNAGIANASMTKPLLEPGMKEKKETR
jgi:hypothetical protein